MLPAAQELLKEGGGVPPHALVVTGDKKAYVPLLGSKDGWRLALQHVLEQRKADRYFVIWHRTDFDLQSPKSGTIFVLATDRTGKQLTVLQEFVGDGEGIRFMEPIVSTVLEVLGLGLSWAPLTW